MARRGSTTLDELFERPYRPGVTFGPRISPLRRWGMLLVLASLVGVIITYWILTDTRRVRAMAESYLSRLTGGKVVVESATLSIFEGLRLDGVTLHADLDPARHPDSLVFKAQTFLVKYNPHSILSGRLEATQIIALEPQVYLCENLDATGATTVPSPAQHPAHPSRQVNRWNWQRMVRQAETATTREAAGPRPKLPEVLLRNAQIHYSRIKDGEVMHEKGLMEIEASFRPEDDQTAVSFNLQSRGEALGVGPVVKGTYNLETRAVAASLESFRFGKDIEVMLPKEVRDWWTQHGLSGTLDIPTFFIRPGRLPDEPNRFRIVTDLKNVTLKILPEEWLSREEDARLAAMNRTMAFMKAAGLDSGGFVSHVHSQFNPTPIEFDKVAGGFVFTEDGIEIERVGGWVEGNPFSVNGKYHGYSPLAAGKFKIEGHGIRIPNRPRYLNSMPPEVRKVYEELKPEGDGSLVLEIERPNAGDKPIVRGQADIHDGRFTFDEFPYPLRNVRGTITFGWDDKTQMNRVDIHHMRGWGTEGGPNHDKYVDVRGFIAPLGRGPAEYDFTITSDKLESEPQLMAAMPKDVRKALRVFDYPGQGLLPRFKGSVVCYVHRDAVLGARWHHTVDIDLEDGAGQLEFFPYLLQGMKGKFRVTDRHTEIYGITARKGDATVTVDGIVRHAKGQPTDPQLKIAARNIPIDSDFLAALDKEEREWIEKLGIGGKLSVDGTIFRDPKKAAATQKTGGKKDEDAIAFDLHLRLKEGVLWPVDGVFAVSDVHADMRLSPSRLLITEASGKRGDASVSADGLISWAGGEPRIGLRARVKNLLLDASLYKMLPLAWREGWDQTRPDGTLDVDVVYNSAPSPDARATAVASTEATDAPPTTQPFSVALRPAKLNMHPKAFPTRMENVKGEIVIRPNLIELKKLTAVRPNKGGSLALSGSVTSNPKPTANGTGTATGNGTANATSTTKPAESDPSRWDITVSGSEIVTDAEFRAALPPGVAKLLDSLSVEGKLSADFSKFVYVPSTSEQANDSQFDFAGAIKLVGNTLDVGVPFADAKGTVNLEGSARGGKLAGLTGSVDLDSVSLSGRHIKDLKAQLLKPATEDALSIRKIDGDIAGGKLVGEVALVFPDQGDSRFGLQLTLRNSDIERLVGDADKDIKGQLTASLALEGSWGATSSRRGRGDVAVSGKEMYRIPLVLGLLQITNLSLPISSPFTEAAARYTVEGERVNFEQIELRASNMLMSGRGHLDFGQKKVDMTFVTDNPNAWKIPFIHELLQGARHELLQIHVTGTIQEPKVKGSLMNTFSTTVDEVLKGDRNGKKKK